MSVMSKAGAQVLCQAGIANPVLSSGAAEAALADIAALCGGPGGHQWDALHAASGPVQANLSPQMQANASASRNT